jgi:hypothetical protein
MRPSQRTRPADRSPHPSSSASFPTATHSSSTVACPPPSCNYACGSPTGSYDTSPHQTRDRASVFPRRMAAAVARPAPTCAMDLVAAALVRRNPAPRQIPPRAALTVVAGRYSSRGPRSAVRVEPRLRHRAWNDLAGKLQLLYDLDRIRGLLRAGGDVFDPDRDGDAFARHLAATGCEPDK